MATRLRKLRITRVDRVHAPANGTDADGPLARIVLAKALDGDVEKYNRSHDAAGKFSSGGGGGRGGSRSGGSSGGGGKGGKGKKEKLKVSDLTHEEGQAMASLSMKRARGQISPAEYKAGKDKILGGAAKRTGKVHKAEDEDEPELLAEIEKAFDSPKADPNHDHSDLKPGDRCIGCGWTKPMAKSTDPGGNMPTEQEQLEQLRKAIDEAVAAATEPLQAQVDQFTEQKAEFDAAVEAAADPTEIDKSALPEAVRKRLEDAEAVAKAAEERVAKIEHEREAARWLEVAKGLPFVAVAKKTDGNAVDETGRLLHSIAKAAGPEAAEDMLFVLEAAQAKLAQSELLKSAGKDGPGTGLGDAGAQLQKAADDIRKAAPNLTTAQAYAQAVAGNPELAIKAQREDISA